MAPMRVAGIRNAIAKAFTDIPSGLRNSSFSTSPGWVVTRLGVAIALVVVDDFDIGRSFFGPGETDAPPIKEAQQRRLGPAPQPVGNPLIDAWICAVGEHLAQRWRPNWTQRDLHFALQD